MYWKSTALFFLLLTFGGCGEPDVEQSQTLGQSRASVFGGVEEQGHDAVGALTTVIRGAYQGSFCTGTLIDPNWVLTAAHCVEGQRSNLADEGIRLSDTDIYFYVGTRAQSRRGDPPRTGNLYRTRRVHLHPQYDADANFSFYDIALLELSERVDETAPYIIRRDDIDPLEGENVLYVGFGVNDGVNREGSGTKRSTNLRLNSVLPAVYITTHGASGICYGDSGGPGLVRTGNRYEVIGVNSTAAGEDEACRDGSMQTRVDVFQTWIDVVMGAGGCGADRDCPCAGVCGRDGVCDAPNCGLDCAGFAECASGCQRNDSDCFFRCSAGAGPTAQATYEDAAACARNCADGDRVCLQERCADELAACFGAPDIGNDDCGGVWNCVNACEVDGCQQSCFEQGTVQAQEAFSEVVDCIQTKCADQSDNAAFSACLAQRCRQAMTQCMPPDDCRVTGGDCPAGTACIPESWAATYCRLTDGNGISADCDGSRVSCEDGAFCTNLGAGPICQEVCLEDADCQARNPPCHLYDDAPVPFGVCIGGVDCPDGDGDGTCDEDDCRPDNALVNPDADEICGNRRDDDCDDMADEGCEEMPATGGAVGAGGAMGAGGMGTGVGGAMTGSGGVSGFGGGNAPAAEPTPVRGGSNGVAAAGCACDVSTATSVNPWSLLGLFGFCLVGLRRRRP